MQALYVEIDNVFQEQILIIDQKHYSIIFTRLSIISIDRQSLIQ